MTNIDTDEIKHYLKLQNKLRSQLSKISEYYSLTYETIYFYNRLMSKQQSDKFMEGWVAYLIEGKKIDSRTIPVEYQNRDLGDIQLGENLIPSKNNIELKYSFNPKPSIGGQQLRLYEPVKWYIFFKGWDADNYEMFLLSKEQLVKEIEERAISSGLTAYSSAQGSGRYKDDQGKSLDNDTRIKILKEEIFTNNRQDLIGWDFNTKTESDYYQSFQSKYKVTPEQVKQIINEV